MGTPRKQWTWVRRLSLTGLAATALLVCGQQPAKKEPDRTKVIRVEKPAAAIVRDASAVKPNGPPVPADMTKKAVVEKPAEAVVRDSSTVKPNGPPAEADLTKAYRVEKPAAMVVRGSGPSTTSDANPKVEAGKVKWHASFDDARAASAKTGRPVLLLHMMGKLDLQFC
jgi:hypothetical protein